METEKLKEIAKKHLKINFNNDVWITAYGEQISVGAMETEHIRKCMEWNIPANYLGGKEKWLKIFNEELKRRE